MTTSERGDRGDRGVQGERGERGDHGQHGEKGDSGPTGTSGPVGRTGPTSPYLGRNQTLVIFAFIVAAFVLLAYRTEVATIRIDQNVYEACLQRVETSKIVADCEGLR